MPDSDEEVYIRFAESVEKWLVRCIAAFIVIIIAAQCLLRIPEIRVRITSVERLEGHPYSDDTLGKSVKQ